MHCWRMTGNEEDDVVRGTGQERKSVISPFQAPNITELKGKLAFVVNELTITSIACLQL